MQKQKKVRLKGPMLATLNESIHTRDGGCAMCGHWVDHGEKFHHIIFRSQRGEDIATNGVTLCRSCHGLAHGPHAKGIREKLQDYIRRLQDGLFTR